MTDNIATEQTQPTVAKKAPVKKTAARKAPSKKTAAKPTTNAAKAKVAKAPSVNVHLEAGINVARYKGPSSFVNSNRPAKVMLGRTVETGKVTSRAQQGLYALREAYSGSAFPVKGFDNGILRDLVGAGLIKLSGGQKTNIDGKEYMIDGSQPLKATITAAGQTYGKA